MRVTKWAVAAALALALTSCSGKKAKTAALPPLLSQSWRVELPVSGFGSAVVALPLGATAPRPVAVVIHGNGDHPDWQCGSFRGVLGGHVFILCPRGKPLPNPASSFALGSVDDTEAELRAALDALKARYGKHVAPSPILLIGYGAGAEHSAELARQEPSFFSRVAMIDGDARAFSPSTAAIYAKGGGKRVLFFCTDVLCHERALARATLLQRGKVGAKAVLGEVGPYLDSRFTTALSPELGWLLEGDARWQKPQRGRK